MLVGSRFRTVIDGDSEPVRRVVLPTEVGAMVEDLRNFITPMFHSSVMFRKTAVLAMGGYDEDILCVEDTDLYVRLIGPDRRPAIVNLDTDLSLKRVHPEQYHYGSKVGVWQSPWGLRSVETVKRRIAEAFGPPIANEDDSPDERPPLPRAADSR